MWILEPVAAHLLHLAQVRTHPLRLSISSLPRHLGLRKLLNEDVGVAVLVRVDRHGVLIGQH